MVGSSGSRTVAIGAAEVAMAAPVFAESATLYLLAVREHVTKIIHVCRPTVTCYLNRSEFVVFGPLLFRQCMNAFWCSKLAFGQWLRKTPRNARNVSIVLLHMRIH